MDGSDSAPAAVPPWTHTGSPAGVICPRCRRLAAGSLYQPWRTTCSPADWVYCIRDPLLIVTGERSFEWVMLHAPVAPVGGTAATWSPA